MTSSTACSPSRRPADAHPHRHRRGLAILANAVIYGTDVFGAIVQRPAIAAVDDRTLTQALGHVHRVADRRLKVITIGGLITAIATTALAAAGGRWVSAAGGTLASLAVISFIAIYTQVAKPVNTALTAAALADRVPDNARDCRPAGTRSSTAASRCRPSRWSRCASRSPRPERADPSVRPPVTQSTTTTRSTHDHDDRS